MESPGKLVPPPEFKKPYKHVLTLSEELLFRPGGPFAEESGNDQSTIRANNRKAMDRLLYASEGLTKQELAEALSLSLPTVSGILQDMQEDGIIETRFDQTTGQGRPPVKYLLDRHAHAFVSIVIKGECVRILVTDAFCSKLLERRCEIPYLDSAEYWRELSALILASILDAGTKPKSVVGVNLLFPNPVDPVKFEVYSREDFPTTCFSVEKLESLLEISVYVNSVYDAVAFELGHGKSGDGNLCYVNVSDKISSVMIAGRRVFRTQGSAPGDAGHLILVPMGRRCKCGKTGCVEAYCSLDIFSAVYGESVETFVSRLNEGIQGSTRIVFWHEYLTFLANFLANQSFTFRMPVFLGGRLAECMGGAVHLLKTLVDEYLATPGSGVLHIVDGEEDLALQGGARIIYHNYI